jgi:Type IV secretion system pilin
MLSVINHFALKTYLTVFTFFVLSFTTVFAQQGPVGQSIRITNPLRIDSLNDLLLAILNIIIVLAIPVVVFFIIYAGFLYVTARGNASQVEQATRALTYAIIGGVLIVGAVAIAEIVRNLVGSFTAP